jgi:beta-glucanase (GH16 family)
MSGPPRVRILAVTAVAVALAAASLAAAIHAQAAVPPTTGAGWSLTFSDDFTGAAGSGVSGNWRYTTGTQYPNGPAHFGTDEIETMTSSRDNVALDGGGNLRITALNNGGNWTSGRIETNREDFQPPAGGKLWVESRLQMPNVTDAAAAGYWPAFWMLGTPYRADNWSWPRIGEIDIMENVNGINREWGTFHCGVTPGGPCNETSGRGNNVPCTGPSCQSAFHTYAIQWDRSTNPQTLKWYLDGVQFHQVNSTDVDAGTWDNATNHGFFILLNLAMGGQFPAALGGGPTGATASGKSMLVDYVAVWSGGANAASSPHATGGPTTQPPTTQPPTTQPPTTAPPTTTPPSSPPPTGTRDAYGTIQAESANSLHGLTVESCSDTGGGQDIATAANGDYAVYNNVDFGSTPATQFIGRAASGAAGGISGLVEVRLDSPGAAPIGSFAIANTGGWQSWRTVPANINAVTGVHTVYITFTSGQPADYVNLNWISFGH